MSKLSSIKNIYFIGIGGIGMSALARYFNFKGCIVSGYDKTPTALTKQLEAEGIAIHYEDNVDLIPKNVDAVVYTPAIPPHHTELNFYRNNGYEVVKRSDVLQWITEASFNICIAGTHGKTTITTMVAHILRDTGYGCNAFLGGISANYQTNFWASNNNVVVVEADEYDRSFLKLSPNIAIITAMDADHLDIYGTAAEVENAFIQFSKKIKDNGCLITKYGLSRAKDFSVPDICTYSFKNAAADIYVTDLKVENASYCFSIKNNFWTLKDVVLNMGGLHNIENVLAAIAVAKYLKIDDEKIKAAVASFKGVKRRFEYIVKNEDYILIDDYAHHPEELRALITGVKSLYPHTKATVVFQPHLFSRTKDLATEFAASLDLADDVILLPIYPARELPMTGVTSELILQKMQLKEKVLVEKDQLIQTLHNKNASLIIMAGAGDIDVLVQTVKHSIIKN
jgi:UDP-N-acetylmuramate--alanine ligase